MGRNGFDGIGALIEGRNSKLVGGALGYVLERLTEEEIRTLVPHLLDYLGAKCPECKMPWRMDGGER